MLSYPAIFHKQEESQGYWVEFPDIEGCFSMGDTLEHAKAMAQEALSLHLASLVSHNERLPKSSHLKGENVYYIQPSRKVLFSLAFKKTRLEMGLTQQEMAQKLHFTQQHINELESVGKANPTLDKIDKIERVLAKELLPL